MRRALVFLVASALLAAVAGRPASGQAADEPIGRELKGIRDVLERLAAAHEADRRYREVDVALKRIELWIKRLEPLDQQLRFTQVELREAEESLESLERMRAQHEEHLAEEIRQNTDAPRSETRRILEDIERSRIGIEERIKAARARAQQYDNDLAAGKKQIEILDERLLELVDED